jgi:hypothetical protein
VTEHRRDRLELAWFFAVMTWSVVRIVAVSTWLHDYGVDPFRYALVDLGSSAPYALASARLLGSLVDGRIRRAAGWTVVTVATFVAPDVYIFAAGRALPWATYVVVGAVATVGASLAIRSGRASVRERRLALDAMDAMPAEAPVIVG